AVLQHREATLVAWIQATGTRGHHLACASKRSSTVICPGNSPKADHELRLKPDHPMGSGQIDLPVQPFSFQRGEETLHCCVVPAVAPLAHAAHNAGFHQEHLELFAGVLTALVGMMQNRTG